MKTNPAVAVAAVALGVGAYLLWRARSASMTGAERDNDSILDVDFEVVGGSDAAAGGVSSAGAVKPTRRPKTVGASPLLVTGRSVGEDLLAAGARGGLAGAGIPDGKL